MLNEEKFKMIMDKHSSLFAENEALAKRVESLSSELQQFKSANGIIGDLSQYFTQRRPEMKGQVLTDKQSVVLGKIFHCIHKAGVDRVSPVEGFKKLWAEYGNSVPDYRRKAMSTAGTTGDEDVLMLEDIDKTIHTLLEEHTFLSKEAAWITTNSHTLRTFNHITSITVSAVDEGGELPETQPGFSTSTATAKKVGAIVLYSTEIDEDVFIDLAPYIVMDIVRSLAKEMERIFLVGNTASPASDVFNGVLNDSNVTTYTMASGNTTFASVNWADLHTAKDSLADATDGRLIWVMHRSIFGYLERAVDSNNNRIFNQYSSVSTDGVLNGLKGELLGFPVYTNSLMPAKGDTGVSTYFIWLGVAKNIRMVVRRGLTIKNLKELYARTDQEAIMFTQRFFIQNMHPTTGVRIRTAAS